MSLTGFLKYGETFLPITRGELVKDSAGNIALHSPDFVAKAVGDPTCPGGRIGLITASEKQILETLSAGDGAVLNTAPLKLQVADGKEYIYTGVAELYITLLAGDNVWLQDDEGDITISAKDPTIQITHIVEELDKELPIVLANMEYVDEKDGDVFTTAYRHDGISYNPYKETLTVPRLDGIATRALGIVPGKNGIGSSINPIFVDSNGEVLASEATVGKSDDNAVQPIYMNKGQLTACNKSIGGPTDSPVGFKLHYMSGGVLVPYEGSLGQLGTFPLCVTDGVLTTATETIGSGIQGIWMQQGNLTTMTYKLEANVNKYETTTFQPENPVNEQFKYLAVYDSGTKADIKRLTGNIGKVNNPVWLSGGALLPIRIPENNSAELYIVGTEGKYSTPNGTLSTGSQSTSGVRIIGGNKVYAFKGFFESSDEKLKDFRSDVKVDLNNLSKLPKKYFIWKSDETLQSQIGTSAQQLQKLYPELVSEDSQGILHVAYDKLSIIALAAVDELHNQIADLRTQNEELKVRLERLERLIYEN